MLEKKLATPLNRYQELEKCLSDPNIIADREKFQSYSKELGDLRGLYATGKTYLQTTQEIKETRALLADPEMQELAKSELIKLEAKEASLAKEIEIMLLPKDHLDEKNIIMEIRAGTGGE